MQKDRIEVDVWAWGEAEEQDRPATEAVRERSVNQLRRAEPRDVARDDELALVLRRDTQGRADILKGGNEDVDSSCIERHEAGDQDNQLPLGEPARFKTGAVHHDDAFRVRRVPYATPRQGANVPDRMGSMARPHTVFWRRTHEVERRQATSIRQKTAR